MKMTIVIDTDDEQGIRDSFKIVSHFYKRIDPRGHYTMSEIKYTKIPFIKMIRAFAKEAKNAEDHGEDSTSLRFAKQWADKAFYELKGL